MEKMIPVIIPAYEPDSNLPILLGILAENNIGPVIVVDDGSGDKYAAIFEKAKALVAGNGGTVLVHEVNKGKGRALKTAFQYILENYQDVIGAVTADSDGQHTVDCIRKVMEALEAKPGELILGVRDFSGDDIPWKSRFGNNLTEKVFAYVAGVHVSDTQTGLRGIPREFMRDLLEVAGERFEFETQMLLESVNRYPISEVEIETIYDSVEDHQTHFDPVADSIKIYRILGKKFLKYIFASFSSSILDLALFSVFCFFLEGRYVSYVAVATVLARIISAVYNYTINYKVVFKSKENVGKASAKYFLLALVQMGLSAALVSGAVMLLPFVPKVVVKGIVDTFLFFVSYHIQQKFVF